MDHTDIIRAAWMLCTTMGASAQGEADSLAVELSQIGAEPAARIWRDVARAVRIIQQGDAQTALH